MGAGSVVLDRQTGKTTSLQPQQDVRSIAVHPEGSQIASFGWSVKGFRLWESATGKLIHAHDEGTIGNGQFTPDGKYLITRANGIPDILLWSVPDGKLCPQLGFRSGFAISPDSRYIAVAEAVGKVRLNRIDNGDMIARSLPRRRLTLPIFISAPMVAISSARISEQQVPCLGPVELPGQLRELKLDWETTPARAAVAVRRPSAWKIVEAAEDADKESIKQTRPAARR